MKALSIIDEVVKALEQDVNLTRIKRLILFACQETWENDASQLENLNLRNLIQELCIRNGNLEDIEATLNRIVSKVNKKTEYALVASEIVRQMAKLYVAAEVEEQTEMESSISHSFGFQVQPYSQPELDPLPPLESEPINPVVDLLDVRQKIQQQTNPLRAKMLIFSTLYHEFTFSDRDWAFLKTQELDHLLQQLLQACPTLGELESKLYSTASHLSSPDDTAQAASVIIQALTPYYGTLQVPSESEPIPQNDSYDQTHLASYSFEEGKPIQGDVSYFQEGEITMMSQLPNGNYYNNPLVIQQFLNSASSLPLVESGANHDEDDDDNDDEDATSALPPLQPSKPTVPPVKVTESIAENSASFSFPPFTISDSIKQKLGLEEEIKGLVTQGVNSVVRTMENTLRELEIALERRASNESLEERLSLKYQSLRNFIDNVQGMSDKFLEILSQLEAAERKRLNLKPAVHTFRSHKSTPTSSHTNQQRILELAKQGHPKAIASLINHSLQSKGITALALIKEGCLHIILESTQIPHQQVTAAFVERKLVSLKPKSIKTVRVHGRLVGHKSVAWTQEFDCQSN
ncbi:MAG: hypothetical protein ACM37W_19080 [Actinomycetota bacterium]